MEHQSEISQKIAEYTKDFRRDYTVIREVEDRDLWRKARDGRSCSLLQITKLTSLSGYGRSVR